MKSQQNTPSYSRLIRWNIVSQKTPLRHFLFSEIDSFVREMDSFPRNVRECKEYVICGPHLNLQVIGTLFSRYWRETDF